VFYAKGAVPAGLSAGPSLHGGGGAPVFMAAEFRTTERVAVTVGKRTVLASSLSGRAPVPDPTRVREER
jgi:hypothetical protein